MSLAGGASPTPPADAAPTAADITRTALALALGAAVSLGLARFAYALLLPAMRADLGWNYATAGAMNTVNAGGYLLGALAMPRLLRRVDARTLLLAGSAAAVPLLAAHALLRGEAALYLLRLAMGAASALTFVAGGLLAARLGQQPGAKPSLVLGLYYGGTGVGIIASAWLAPALPWAPTWVALALVAAVATAGMALGTSALRAAASAPGVVPGSGASATPAGAAHATASVFRWRDFWPGLAGYTMFGLGYIGYMTFNVTLLREQGASTALVTGFYTLLGLGVIASSWLWAGLLQRQHGGAAMALLNGLLALATALPVMVAGPLAALASGALFGAVFLSVVASTTALVRHNLPPAAWASGISAFTVVFAGGQIVGPVLVGWLSDGAGGLTRGLVVSAALLALGALLALRQRPLARRGPAAA